MDNLMKIPFEFLNLRQIALRELPLLKRVYDLMTHLMQVLPYLRKIHLASKNFTSEASKTSSSS